MKKAWFALAALAGIAVWSAAVEYSVMRRGGLTVRDCETIRSVFLGRDTANGTFMIEALGLENGCIPPDRHVTRRIVKRLHSFENPGLSIVDYVDRLLLTHRDDAAARWLPAAAAVHLAWDRLPLTNGTAPQVRSSRLRTEIDKLHNTLKGDDTAAIVDSLEKYLSRPALAPSAEWDAADQLLKRLRLIATREYFYWYARSSEWRRTPTTNHLFSVSIYNPAIICDDSRAIRRVAELFLAGQASDLNGEYALRGLLRIAEKYPDFPDLAERIAAKLGDSVSLRLEPFSIKYDREVVAPDNCTSAIQLISRQDASTR
ncbi:MAG: hypothetical protein C6Y20_05460 [Tagaea sp. CACIAM 22H2]|nr:hypothetical protein [Tagaea sp. CACIAM 22H2]